MTRAGSFICVLIMTLLMSACATMPDEQQASVPEQRQPQNVIVILVDDMGFSDLGAFGSEVPTPNLDRLALGGVRLTDFHSTSKCFPSRASLITGLYADDVNRGSNARQPLVGGVTLAESFRAAGFATFMVGKEHSLTHPMDRGFDRYWGLRDGAANFFNPGIEARAGEPEPARKAGEGRWWCFERECQQGFLPEDPDFYATDAFTEKAIEYIAEADAANERFFLYLAYTAPHDPLQAPEAHIAPFRGTYSDGYGPVADARYARQLAMGLIDERYPRPVPTWRQWDTLSADERADQSARMEVYAGMIANLDANVGRLIDALEARGFLEDTLIVFTSDNGASAEVVLEDGKEIGASYPIGTVGRWASLEGDWAEVANTPFRLYKNESFHGGTAVPTFVFWPAGALPAGEIWDGPAHLIDLHPTLLALIGREYDPALGADGPAQALRGIDLSAAILRLEQGEREGLIFNRWQSGRMVRSSDWKLVSRNQAGSAWELYDMRNDRTETRDLAAAQPEIVAELSAAYDAWAIEVGVPD